MLCLGWVVCWCYSTSQVLEINSGDSNSPHFFISASRDKDEKAHKVATVGNVRSVTPTVSPGGSRRNTEQKVATANGTVNNATHTPTASPTEGPTGAPSAPPPPPAEILLLKKIFPILELPSDSREIYCQALLDDKEFGQVDKEFIDLFVDLLCKRLQSSKMDDVISTLKELWKENRTSFYLGVVCSVIATIFFVKDVLVIIWLFLSNVCPLPYFLFVLCGKFSWKFHYKQGKKFGQQHARYMSKKVVPSLLSDIFDHGEDKRLVPELGAEKLAVATDKIMQIETKYLFGRWFQQVFGCICCVNRETGGEDVDDISAGSGGASTDESSAVPAMVGSAAGSVEAAANAGGAVDAVPAMVGSAAGSVEAAAGSVKAAANAGGTVDAVPAIVGSAAGSVEAAAGSVEAAANAGGAVEGTRARTAGQAGDVSISQVHLHIQELLVKIGKRTDKLSAEEMLLLPVEDLEKRAVPVEVKERKLEEVLQENALPDDETRRVQGLEEESQEESKETALPKERKPSEKEVKEMPKSSFSCTQLWGRTSRNCPTTHEKCSSTTLKNMRRKTTKPCLVDRRTVRS